MVSADVNEGSNTSVYVPLTGSVIWSVNPLLPHMPRPETSTLFPYTTLFRSHPLGVTLDARPLTMSPMFPAKVSRPFWPGYVIVTGTLAPFAVGRPHV